MTDWLNSFRIRLTLISGGLVLGMSLGISVYVNHVASIRLTQASAEAIQSAAQSISNALAVNLTEREREIVFLSQTSAMTRGDLARPETREALERRRRAYRNYAWISVADLSGIVRSATRGMLQGKSVRERKWFVMAQQGPYVGDAHEAVLLAKMLEGNGSGEPLRFVDFAAPVRGADGTLRGVLAAHANWAWVKQTIQTTLSPAAQNAGVEAIVVSKTDDVLYPYDQMGSLVVPRQLLSRDGYFVLDWGKAGKFLTASVGVRADTVSDLGWRVIVRQPVPLALASVRDLHRHLLVIGVLITVAFMVLAYRLAASFSRPVEHLAWTARRIQQGEEDASLLEPSNVREIHELSDSLQGMTGMLIARRNEVEKANVTLEQKVRERTLALSDANRELERLARRDALTGLWNRLSANERLEEEFLRMKRIKQPYSVLLLDIDHFKRVNDTHGHEVGDQVLKHTGEILHDSARATDFVARFGGEEFIVLLPNTADKDAVFVAEKIRKVVAEADIPTVGRVTFSIGVATASLNDPDQNHAVRLADTALYQAKAGGRNRVCAFAAD